MKKPIGNHELSIYLGFIINLVLIAGFLWVLPMESQYFSISGEAPPSTLIELGVNGFKKQMKASEPTGHFSYENIPAYSHENQLTLEVVGGLIPQQTLKYQFNPGFSIRLSGLLVVLFFINSLLFMGRMMQKKNHRPAPNQKNLTQGIEIISNQTQLSNFIPPSQRGITLFSSLEALGSNFELPSGIYYSRNDGDLEFKMIGQWGVSHLLFRESKIIQRGKEILLTNPHLDIEEILPLKEDIIGQKGCGFVFLVPSVKLKAMVFLVHDPFREGLSQEGPPQVTGLFFTSGAVEKMKANSEIRTSFRALLDIFNLKMELSRQGPPLENSPQGDKEGLNLHSPSANQVEETLATLFHKKLFRPLLTRELERAERYHLGFTLALVGLDPVGEGKGPAINPLTPEEIKLKFSQILREAIRPYDVLCQYTRSDYFALLLTSASDKEGVAVMKRLRQLVSRKLGGKKGGVTFSGGLSSYPADTTLAENLLEMAESALDEAILKGNSVLSYGNLYNDKPHSEEEVDPNGDLIEDKDPIA